MKGNLKSLSDYRVEEIKRSEIPRIFLSRQQRDKTACRKIAEYLIEAGVYVYYDDGDPRLNQTREPEKVTEIIAEAIAKCNHMLCHFKEYYGF